MRQATFGATAGLLVLHSLLPAPALALDAAQMLSRVTPSVYTVATLNAQRVPLATGSAWSPAPASWSRPAMC